MEKNLYDFVSCIFFIYADTIKHSTRCAHLCTVTPCVTSIKALSKVPDVKIYTFLTCCV